MKKKQTDITQVVHPAILERARVANERYNEFAIATNRNGISLETSTAMVELASIQHDLRELQRQMGHGK